MGARLGSVVLGFGVAIAVAAVACSSNSGDVGGGKGYEDDTTKVDGSTAPSPTGTPAAPAGPSCANAIKDDGETDIDCGGVLCPPCANGHVCAASSDCVSLVCTDGKCSTDAGCSDGTREAFAAVATFPNIAACAGAWALPGILTTTNPACGRVSGNSSANPNGTGCNVADLCQVGWHVCTTPAEVMTKSNGGGCAAAGIAAQNAFYTLRQSGNGGAACGVGTNDLFGCGDVGVAPDPASCAPLDRFSNDLCAALPPTWACGANGADEAGGVTKTSSDNGGVLCCRD